MKKIALLTVCLMASLTVMANGDPVAVRSALTLSRTPVAVHVPEIKLLDEYCSFSLHDGYVDVEARYLLHNQSSKDFKALPYGFPIDWLGCGESHWESLNFVSESIVERGWRDSYVQDVMFSLGGQSLPWQCSKDTVLRAPEHYIEDFLLLFEIEGVDENDPLIQPDSAEYHYSAKRTKQILDKYGAEKDAFYVATPALNRRWYYVYLDITAGQTVELKVRYRLDIGVSRGGLYEEYKVFRNTGYMECRFEYDFSPAAYWGDGHAQRFAVEVDTTDILRHPVWQNRGCIEAKGLPLQKKGRGLHYETRNFDLAAAEPLEISYVTKHIHEDVADLLSHRIAPDQYTITLSGVDPKYPVDNLSDMDLSTATVLRPDNRDSIYITITFRDSVMLTGVLLYNGYCKDRQAWLNNSRIGFLKFQGLFGGGDECKAVEPVDFTWQGLTDAAMKMSVLSRKMDYQFPWEWNDYRQKTKEITIRISDIVVGRKYNDLCVSEIILIGD